MSHAFTSDTDISISLIHHFVDRRDENSSFSGRLWVKVTVVRRSCLFEARSLMADVFCSVQESLPSGGTLPKAWRTSMRIGSNQNPVEVSVRTGCEQFPTQSSQTSAMMNHGESNINADAPVSTTVYGLSHDASDDPESGMEKGHAAVA